MTKRIKSFSLSDHAIAKITALAKQRGVSESAVVENLISGPEIVADNDQGSAATARARMHAAGMATAGGVDTEKIAAFQRKAGMDIFDAKRRGKR